MRVFCLLALICATSFSLTTDPDAPVRSSGLPPNVLLNRFHPCAEHVAVASDEPISSPSAEDRQLALELVQKFGTGPLAYSALEPGMKYFFAEGGVIPYATRFGANFILEGPIGPEGSASKLLQQFIAANPETYVCAASEATAQIVTSKEINHYANEMGEVVDLDLETYTVEGSDRASMRRGYHRLMRNYDIIEGSWNLFPSEEILSMTDRWRSLYGAKTSLGIHVPSMSPDEVATEQELGFLARPLRIKQDEPDVRKFFVATKDSPKRLVAYYIFDPMYENNEVIGYHLNFKRRSPEADKKTEEAFVMHAVKLFQAESKKRVAEGRSPIRYLSMGLLPLYNIQDRVYSHSLSLSTVLRGFERASRVPAVARRTFNFYGHGQFKSRFDGNHRSIYFTTPHEWNARSVFGLMDLCNVRIWGVSSVLQWYYGGNR